MTSDQPPIEHRSTVVIGVFDGVHRGHRALINLAHQHATSTRTQLDVLSFDPHPAQVLFPDAFLGLLTDTRYRAELLVQAGADAVNYIPFNEITMMMSPSEFVDTYVVAGAHANSVFVGENFRFGHKAQGDVRTLTDLCAAHGIDVHVVPLQGDGTHWSSTRIRQHIIQGDVEGARAELDRPHRLSGTVVHGDHRGRELGFPTANLSLSRQYVVPADGVYSAILHTDQGLMKAAVSIGTNPTFKDVFDRRVEAFALDQEGIDLYDQAVDLDFIGHIRQMEAFSDIDSLLVAMNRDVAIAREQLAQFD